MFKPAADAWALEVARQVASRGTFETTHVELKSRVPEPKEFARQMAGLANAAAWHPVLLLLGLDQQEGVVGVSPFEVGDWYQSLRSCFEYGEAPALVYQNFLALNDKQIAAFVFETDNPPYVLASSKQGGPREVPWRYGANTGVAGRRELLSLLLRRIADPEVEFTKAEVRVSTDGTVRATAELFVYPAPGSDELAMPLHRVQVQIADARGAVQHLPDEVRLRPVSEKSQAKLVDDAVIVRGVSKLELTAHSEAPCVLAMDSSEIEISLAVRPARAHAPARFVVMVARRDHPDFTAYWELHEHHRLPLRTSADTLREIQEVLRANSFARRTNWNPLGELPRPDDW